MKNTGKNKSAFLKEEELNKVEILMSKGIKFIDIVRRGIDESFKEKEILNKS